MVRIRKKVKADRDQKTKTNCSAIFVSHGQQGRIGLSCQDKQQHLSPSKKIRWTLPFD